MKFTRTLVILLPLLTGCAGLGPTQSDHWGELVAQGAGGDKVLFESVGNWYPDTLVRETAPRFGAFVITPAGVEFLQWDGPSHSYQIIFREPFSKIAQCTVDTPHGIIGKKLVLIEPDYRHQTFELAGPNDVVIDKAATARALALINSSVKGGCEHPLTAAAAH